jgi:predicted ATPase
MPHLRSVEVRPFAASLASQHPFRLPLIQGLPTIDLSTPVTFFVGENGSGKSTLLEAIACAAGLPSAGAEDLAQDPTLVAARALADQLRLAWNRRTQRGLFLRAEDFFGYAKREAALRADLAHGERQVDVDLKNSSDYARMLAKGVYRKEQAALRQRYGDGIDTRSHGEGFLEFFQQRFIPGGLYLLDEPEAPLSPQRQLTLISLIKHALTERAQFVIATHSPILMALEGARILEFRGGEIAPIAYEDTEHYRITSAFLKNPKAFLDRL